MMVDQVEYKTSRISFFYNYVLCILLFLFLILIHLVDLSYSFRLISVFVCTPLILIIFFEPEFVRSYRYYILDEENITMVEGILSKKKVSIPNEQIVSTTLLKTVLGRIFNFGDVKISGFNTEIVIKGIRNPDKVYEFFQEKIKSKSRKK